MVNITWQCKKCLTHNEEDIENVDIHKHKTTYDDTDDTIIMELQCVHCGTLLTQTKGLF